MKNIIHPEFKVGILGGGQLGKMLCLSAQNWHLQTWILDVSNDFPAGQVCSKFVTGNFKNYDDVYSFGKQVDVLTIEIEHVNIAALQQLESEGVVVHPSSSALKIIKDKGLQKQFYQKNNLPSSNFELYESEMLVKEHLKNGTLQYPFVQKSRTGGYDGRGVAVIRSEQDLPKLLPGACVIEDLVDIQKELAVIVAKNESGEVQCFPAVEMELNPVANLVEFLSCPADITDKIADEAKSLAKATIEAYDICGLLAVELFLTNDNQLLVNEVAPRTHNSGHHTIDSCYTSQFQQQLRAILNLPLGSTRMLSPSIMVNLLGEDGFQGQAIYEGLDQCMAEEGVKIHLYGKEITKPFRKMGHATVLAESLSLAREKARLVKEKLKIIA